jgi:hypothetical protein
MPATIIYPASKKILGKPFFPLPKIGRQRKETSAARPRAYFTQAVYELLQDIRYDHISREGIIGLDGRPLEDRRIHQIHMRTQKGPAPTIYLMETDINEIAGHFLLPAEVISGAYFVAPKNASLGSNRFSVKPRFAELFSLEWRDKYTKWLAGTDQMPEPEFPWETLKNGAVPLPCLPHSPGQGKKTGRGTLLLMQTGAERLGRFQLGNWVRSWTLGPDRPIMRESHFLPEDTKVQADEIFKKDKFEKLLGEEPEIFEYCCVQKSGKGKRGQIGLCSLEKLHHVLEFPSEYQRNHFHHLRFIRKEREIIVEVSTGPGEKVFGIAKIPLDARKLPGGQKHPFKPIPQ